MSKSGKQIFKIYGVHSSREGECMIAAFERLAGVGLREQGPAWVVGLGHGATHWIAATFYLLLPYLQSDLGFTYSEAGLLVSMFHAMAFAANFGSGMLVDLVGRRVLVQVVALVVGALALMLFGLAGGLVALGALVAMIGATNNLWHPAAISFLSGAYPGNRGFALSVHTLGATLGDSLAPICIGALLAALTWQQAALWGGVPALLMAATIAIVLGRASTGVEASPTGGMTARHYFRGLRQMFTHRPTIGLCLMTGFRSMTQNGLLMFIPIYLANVLKVGPLMTGIGIFALQAGGFIAGPAAGAWSDRIGRRPIVLACATGTTLVIVFLALARNQYVFIVGVSVLGFVLFAIRPVVHSWMMDITPARLHGSAVSAMFGMQSGLSLIVPLAGGWLADRHGVGAVFYLLAITMLAANVLVATLPNAAPGRATEVSGRD
ncbi:MFS transporter [Spiribacter halobius]|uniref:MFS transporter n=1 Tax=Sediminicurvatus halobius TaxID=2182432 RepID=A0A2U2MWX9_9GAMM|nr:MFS transporter [Spiribacter halobius]PWG61363.1 MFS transporter [Spiribacter halobius]UEX76578.1 MFS transporter [Spiribacter halobius]